MPSEIWTQRGQFLGRHLVIDLFRFALAGAVQGALGERGLDVHDDFRLARGFFRGITEQFEHLLHVGQILFSDFYRLFVIFEVVVAIRQAKAALLGGGDHLLSVLEVGLGAEFEEYADAIAVQANGFLGKVVLGF